MNQSLNLAFKYTEESIEKCRQLAEFLRKRQEIEDEYAKSLRKLCKSVSLRPLKKQGWFSRKSSSRPEEGEEEIQTILLRSDLWSTFYEIVDDTSQIAKAHSILAESITNQILGPFEESIKTMDMNRRRTLEEANSVSNELNEAFSILRRATQQLEDTTNEVNATRLGLSRAEGAMTIKPRELERTRTKYQTASEKLAIARASYRQCDDVCRSLQNKVQMVDFPRISRMLSSLEAARSTETRQILLSSARLERRTAEMDVQCAVMMEEKVGGIALDDIFDNLMMTSGGVNGSISGGGGGGNCGALNEINGTNLETDARRYSITRPLVARTGLQDQSSNTNPSNNNSSTPRTLAGNPVPSYYPSATFKASAEILDRKNVGSQIIQ